MRSPDGGEADDDAFEAMLTRVIAAGKKTGTPTGMHVMSPDAALKRAAQCMQFLAIGSELRMMTQEAQAILKTLGGTAGKDVARY
jgi:4-hydroxy-2-oxoheptanedioate aldolase